HDAVARGNGKVVHDLAEVDAMSIEVPAAALAGLQRNPNIEYIEDDVERHALALTTPSTGSPYHLGQLVPYGIKLVQADQLPDHFAANRTVCIIDSGYEAIHEDLAGNTVDGKNLTNSGKWYTDELAHGTHVGGTISAVNNGVGVVGVMPNKQISLYIAKVFDATNSARSSTINRAALDCSLAGANVVSMSLGGSDTSRTDQRVFQRLADKNILSIAAAGNDGDTTISYPGGYASVMAVAAIDENKQWANFSQYNATVAIAGPGVGVLSSVPMGTGRGTSLTVGGVTYTVLPMEGSPVKSVTAPLANFGLGTAVDPAMAGKVCLIQRGTIAFADKVLNCQNSGGVGAIVYNNTAGALNGTLGTTVTTIPSVGATQADGTAMLAQIGVPAALAVTATNYAYYDGTSMATPHVSAVAALVWSYYPGCSAAQIRSTLEKSALDIADPGYDVKTGAGLVQAKAAYDRITQKGCSN
ncbi:MAG TPA: S8 family serine peptidase, partial [Burkholderiaceae bacterium]|nr:S8 family serine peptidase [Burkholderiaceae bacterium]